MHICMQRYMYIYIYVYMHTFAYMCIHIYMCAHCPTCTCQIGYPNPKQQANTSTEMQDSVRRGAVAIALSELDRKTTKMTFRLQKKPVCRVFALKDVDTKDGLRMLPWSTKFSTKPAAPGTSGLECKVGGATITLQRHFDEKHFVAEFWQLRTVPDQKDANMILKMVSTKVECGELKAIAVSIPVAVNNKLITAGDELVLFKPAVAREEKTPAPVAVMIPKASAHGEPASKKAKKA
jgi:hypothetical protein